MKNLLIISWEYPNVSSKQGAALARRVGQVAKDFERNKWQVTIIHKDQINEVKNSEKYHITQETPSLKRISIQGEGINEYKSWEKISLLRQLSTLLICFFKGDRSFRWASKVNNLLPIILPKTAYKPDLIISFFTPRGPMIVGHYASKYYNSPWIADLQDSLDEGYNLNLLSIISKWTTKILKNAKAITHVSPEWALRDGKLINREIKTIRHAIPLIENQYLQPAHETFTILYAGSLDPKNQPIDLFVDVYNQLRSNGFKIELQLAGNEYLLGLFKEKIQDQSSINYLGWLGTQQLQEKISQANCLLVLPWTTIPRQVIPSKFFEFAPYNKPILVIGEDTGSFEILFKELEHPVLAFGNKEFQYKAIVDAIHGNYQNLFELQKCKKTPLKEDSLFNEFFSLLK